jgi:hypothetical protein
LTGASFFALLCSTSNDLDRSSAMIRLSKGKAGPGERLTEF